MMRRVFGVLVVAVFVLAPGLAHATTWTFTKVADLTAAIPGGTGNFTGFGIYASLDGGNVAFWGSGTGQDGIYTDIGGSLGVVANLTTAIPGGTGNFVGFYNPLIDGGNVAFSGGGTNQSGIYTYIGGSLGVVADLTTAIPGGTGNFTSFGVLPSIDGGNVAFNGWGTGQDGIYTYIGGSLGVVANLTTAIPGGSGNFTLFNNPSLDGGNVAFNARGTGQQGIYTNVGGSLGVVADLTTPIPGGTGNFTLFRDAPSLDGGNVAFAGDGTNQIGVYTNVGGSLGVVADKNTAIPGGTGNFSFFSNPSLDGGNVAFLGAGTNQMGIYTNVGGSLQKVIDRTDTLDGKTIAVFWCGQESLSGNAMVFTVGFNDGSTGIYIATPEPATMALLALGLAGIIATRRKKCIKKPSFRT